jgi:hypothetical protein
MWTQVTEHNYAQLREGDIIGRLKKPKAKQINTEGRRVVEADFIDTYIIISIDKLQDKLIMNESLFGYPVKKTKYLFVSGNYYCGNDDEPMSPDVRRNKYL